MMPITVGDDDWPTDYDHVSIRYGISVASFGKLLLTVDLDTAVLYVLIAELTDSSIVCNIHSKSYVLKQGSTVGGSASKAFEESGDKVDNDGQGFVERFEATVLDELAQKAMVQREVQMAVNLVMARDAIWIFGSACRYYGCECGAFCRPHTSTQS